MKNGKIDQEIKAIKRVSRAVEGLDAQSQWRVLNYVMSAKNEPIPYTEQLDIAQTGIAVAE